jgi:uncharacterized membrane protein (DUF4010 family)
VVYAVVIFAIAAAKDYFGTGGLYVVAVLSGLTDLDAITLSTGRLAAANRIDIATGWRLILLAALANLVFKGGIVAVLGPPALTWRIVVLFGIAVVGGLLIFWLWPNDLMLPWPPR